MENSEKSSSPAPSSSAAGGKEKIEKQARQLAYDTRYKVKQSMAANKGGKMDPAAVRKAYIAQLGKSPSSPPVKARAKEMLVGEQFINTDQLVHKSAVSVLEKVFSEKYKKSKSKKPEGGDRRPGVGCEDIKEDSGEKTYKVRVTDKKTNNTYVRMATRAKISELRSNPNISSVEMTGYGSPTKSEKHSGKNTAAVKSGKGDEVSGKDNKIDLKKESYSSLRSENFDGFLELIEKKDKKKSKITGEGVNNKKLIKVFPDDVEEQVAVDPAQKDIQSKQKKQSQLKKQVLQKKLQAVRSGGGEDITASYQPEGEVTEGNQRDPENLKKDRTRSKQPDPSKSGFTGIGNMSIKDIQKMNARMKKEEVETEVEVKNENEKDPNGKAKKQEEEDPRGMATKINLVRNKLRAMGLKMSHEIEGEMVDENRMAAYTAGAGEGSPASRPTVSKKTADRVSRSSDERAFGNRKKKEGIRLSPTKKYSGKDKGKVVKRANTTGRGTPVQYRKSHEDPDMGRYQQKVTQGSGSIKGLKKESLWDAYLKVYEHHQKDADGKVIEHGDGTPSSVEEAKVDTVKYGTLNSPAKEKARNERKFGKLGWNQGGQSQLRKGAHWANRGDKKVRGAKQIDEEGYDRMRDDRLVKYGIGHDGSDRKSTPSRRTPDNQKIKGKTVLQKETEKKYGKGKSAVDIVRAKIQAKHGKGAIMDTKKKS